MLHSVHSIHERLGHQRVLSRPPPGNASTLSLNADLQAAPSQGSLAGIAEEEGGSAIKGAQTPRGAPLVKTVSKKSAWGALFSRTLPSYKGPHDVGIFDIEVPVERRRIGTFKVREEENHLGGFDLDTVLFSVFYPCEEPKPEKVVWFPKLSQTVNGFLKMARRTSWLYKMLAYPIAAAAIYGTTFPASPEANLKRPSDEEEGVEDGKWPLLIFSHGVGCSRLMYSSLCGELASRGYIVCAVEHRDGTGPSSSIRLMDGTIKNVEFLNWQDLDWPKLSEKHQPTNDTTLRHDQLEMRQAEIEEIVKAMRGIAGGEPVIESSLRSPHFDWKRWGPEWNAVDVSKPIMMGHSLGGTVALQVAAQTERFDFSSVVAYDPAIQRLEPWTGTIPCPLLCVNSEEFTLSTDFSRLQSLAQTADSSPPIYSIGGSTHPSFSDVFLIVPGFINRRTGLLVDSDEMLDTTMEITLAFLHGSQGVPDGDDAVEQPGPYTSLDNVPRLRERTQSNFSTTTSRSRLDHVSEWEGPLSRPLGQPGDVNWHPVSEEYSMLDRRRSRKYNGIDGEGNLERAKFKQSELSLPISREEEERRDAEADAEPRVKEDTLIQ